jgi:hypothetical protein
MRRDEGRLVERGGSMNGNAIEEEARWGRLVTKLECPIAVVVRSGLSLTDVRQAIAISGKESAKHPARCC